jgi:hypothetical protein
MSNVTALFRKKANHKLLGRRTKLLAQKEDCETTGEQSGADAIDEQINGPVYGLGADRLTTELIQDTEGQAAWR